METAEKTETAIMVEAVEASQEEEEGAETKIVEGMGRAAVEEVAQSTTATRQTLIKIATRLHRRATILHTMARPSRHLGAVCTDLGCYLHRRSLKQLLSNSHSR